jgi:hypothetical protein
MSFRKMFSTMFLASILGASLLSAHDADQHKGTPTEGQITSIAADRMVMKTAQGNLTVMLNKDTKFEHGDQAADRGHFKAGDKVSVFGTKLATGELVAKEVVMPMPGAKGAAKQEGDHKH